MKRKPISHSGGFSLVELLGVIAIMGLLSALTMTSISSLRSTTLTTAGNDVVNVFAMARQNSVTKSCYTAIVVRTEGTDACTAYTLLQLVRQDDGSFSGWTQLTPWKYLPQGVVFETSQPSVDTYMATSQNSGSNAAHLPAPLGILSSMPFQGSPVDLSNSVNVQCYQPDGTLIGGQAMRLRLIQGTADPSAGTTTYTGTTVAGNEVNFYDLYFIANTGATKVVRN